MQKIPSVVIGRRGVDNVLVEYIKSNGMILVDISTSARFIHQGIDDFRSVKRDMADQDFNMPIHLSYKNYRRVMMEADYSYNPSINAFIKKH